MCFLCPDSLTYFLEVEVCVSFTPSHSFVRENVIVCVCLFFFFFFFKIQSCCVSCGFFVPQPGIEPEVPAFKV